MSKNSPKLIGYKATDEHILFIKDLKENKGLTWSQIVDEFNKKFVSEDPKTHYALKKYYKRYKDLDLSSVALESVLKQSYVTKKKNISLTKEVRVLTENLQIRDDILEEFSELIQDIKFKKVKIDLPKRVQDKNKKSIALELLLSDLHFGMKAKNFNLQVAKNRIDKITDTTIKEIDRVSKDFNIEKVVVLLNGDIMHGNNLHPDSQASCELTDSEQVIESIKILFFQVISIIASTGVKVEVIGMTGNHDRAGKDRPIVNAGKTYLTYIIYQGIKLLSEAYGFTNVNFFIPEEEFFAYDMFGHLFIVEHGHVNGVKPNPNSLEAELLKRANQLGIVAKGIRIGHYHMFLCSEVGRHVVNGSLCGSSDHFSASMGYNSTPCQVLSYYVENNSRNTSFWYSFPINVGNIGE